MGRIKKEKWKDLEMTTLTRLLGHRLARIEMLKSEVSELQKLISRRGRI